MSRPFATTLRDRLEVGLLFLCSNEYRVVSLEVQWVFWSQVYGLIGPLLASIARTKPEYQRTYHVSFPVLFATTLGNVTCDTKENDEIVSRIVFRWIQASNNTKAPS